VIENPEGFLEGQLVSSMERMWVLKASLWMDAYLGEMSA
jgi:hypothetical protein